MEFVNSGRFEGDATRCWQAKKRREVIAVELQVLGSVTEITFLRCIKALVIDMRDTYIHAH